MTKICYLMRHGQTVCNQKKQFYGSLESPLTDKGHLQAKRMADILKLHEVGQIYVSQLSRSQETARFIFPNRSLTVLSDLNEKDFGLWEGLTADDIEQAFPDEWQQWLEAPLSYTPPEAEPFSLFRDRVQTCMQSILDASDQSFAIVAHLGVLRIIYQSLVDSSKDFWDIDVPQGQILCLRLDEDSGWNIQLLK